MTQPILITGATGTLGQAFRLVCRIRGLPALLLDRAALDIAGAGTVAAALRQHRPWAVVNAAGYVRVDAAEAEAARCLRENATGPALLAAACAAQGVQLATFSSDLVFDGRQPTPYLETDAPNPLGVYGRSKQQAEQAVQAVLAALPTALVVRTSAFFSAWDQYNFVYFALGAARRGAVFAAADDLLISPTYVPDLVNTTLDLLLDRAGGLWHLANQGACTWAELARRAVQLAGHDPGLVEGRPAASFGWVAPRPRYAVLGSCHGALLPDFESGLHRYLDDERQLSSPNPPALLVG